MFSVFRLMVVDTIMHVCRCVVFLFIIMWFFFNHDIVLISLIIICCDMLFFMIFVFSYDISLIIVYKYVVYVYCFCFIISTFYNYMFSMFVSVGPEVQRRCVLSVHTYIFSTCDKHYIILLNIIYIYIYIIHTHV